MNLSKVFFVFILLSSSILKVKAQQACTCKTALERLITRIETDYPGFKEKTTGNIDLYTNLKLSILSKSDTIDVSNCFKLLTAYTSFFKDEHIYLQENRKNTATAESPVAQEAIVEVEAKKLSKDIFYIKIASFKYDNIGPVKELIEKNKKQIESASALIIDVRDNFGGTDDVYHPLLPYILTNPLRIMNVEFLATPTLINGLRDYALKNIKKDTANAIKQIEEGLQEYKDNLGKFVLYDGKKVTIDTISLKTKSPKQIVILANNNVASAGENFLYSARQSKKVKILGTPSMGVLDYGSIREFKFGCDDYTLYLPTYRSARLPKYPIDNIGIQPDVYLDDTIDNWLDFAIQYIKQ